MGVFDHIPINVFVLICMKSSLFYPVFHYRITLDQVMDGVDLITAYLDIANSDGKALPITNRYLAVLYFLVTLVKHQ